MTTIQSVPVSTICKYLAAYSQKNWDVNSWDYVATYSDFTHTFKNEHGEYITLHIYDANNRVEFIQYLIDNINITRDEYLTLPVNSVKIFCAELGHLPHARRFNLYNHLYKCPGFKEHYPKPKKLYALLDRCTAYDTLSDEDINQVKYIIASLDFYGRSNCTNAANIINALLHTDYMTCDCFATKAKRMGKLRALRV